MPLHKAKKQNKLYLKLRDKMVSTGMIFQYNNAEGKGLLMLSDGEKKEFSVHEWTDKLNALKVGLRILYENDNGLIKIKMATHTDKVLPKKKKCEVELSKKDLVFSSLEEYIDYYKACGYKLVNDSKETQIRNVVLRKFSVDKHEEVKISLNNSRITLIELLNGKPIK